MTAAEAFLWSERRGDQQRPPHTIKGRVVDDVLIIEVSGSVDFATQTAVRDALYDILTAHTPSHVVINLAALDFCDCAGMRTLLRACGWVTVRGAACRLRDPRPHIAWLLKAVSTDDLAWTDSAP